MKATSLAKLANWASETSTAEVSFLQATSSVVSSTACSQADRLSTACPPHPMQLHAEWGAPASQASARV